MHLKPQRIVLKISGEHFSQKEQIIAPEQYQKFSLIISKLHALGYQIAIILGAGNIWRGARGCGLEFNRNRSDQMGMLASIMNAIALYDQLLSYKVHVQLLTAMPLAPYQLYNSQIAAELVQTDVLLIAGGTGHAGFSTDTAAAMVAGHINADLLIKGTQVDGIYDKDPKKFPSARKIDQISYKEVIAKDLCVQDLSATAICMDYKIPIQIFRFEKPNDLLELLSGHKASSKVIAEP